MEHIITEGQNVLSSSTFLCVNLRLMPWHPLQVRDVVVTCLKLQNLWKTVLQYNSASHWVTWSWGRELIRSTHSELNRYVVSCWHFICYNLCSTTYCSTVFLRLHIPCWEQVFLFDVVSFSFPCEWFSPFIITYVYSCFMNLCNVVGY
jgi:hypothetical protein